MSEQTEGQKAQTDEEIARDPDTRIAELQDGRDVAAATVSLDALGEMTPSQIENLKRIREAVLDLRWGGEGRQGNFLITRFDVEMMATGEVSVSIEGRRHDCERYSPRATLTEVGGEFTLGPNGRIDAERAREGTSKADLRKHPLIYGVGSTLSQRYVR